MFPSQTTVINTATCETRTHYSTEETNGHVWFTVPRCMSQDRVVYWIPIRPGPKKASQLKRMIAVDCSPGKPLFGISLIVEII